jgi:hypothetical protein
MITTEAGQTLHESLDTIAPDGRCRAQMGSDQPCWLARQIAAVEAEAGLIAVRDDNERNSSSVDQARKHRRV